ncbi:hypothetical protein R5R35_001831 [Gryllus longicercus]|uniref:Anaphase-promoting complex subunit 15 n=1 Tax=Gryllus longicercus TaxID=2509291 RepID=A0AAN9VZM9_9ORTH
MPIPLFPTLMPKVTDPLWFSIDRPCDDENELAVLEQEQQTWMTNIAQEDCDILPIGKTALEMEEEEEDDEEEDDNDDDSDSHDDEDDEELDMEVSYDRDSPVDVR